MLFARLLGMISGYMLTLSYIQTYPLVTHRRRGVPGIGGAIDLGKAGAAASKGGKAGEGVKGGGELGKITATPAGPSTAKPGGFSAAPKPEGHPSPSRKTYEPGGPSHNSPVTPARKPEIAPASPDPSLPSRPSGPKKFPIKLINYFADTKKKFSRMIFSRVALERQVDPVLEEYVSLSESYLEAASKVKPSAEAPELANDASGKLFWSRMMNKIRPQGSAKAAPTRTWKWLQSLWKKSINSQEGKIPASGDIANSVQGAESFVPNRQLNDILQRLGKELTKGSNSPSADSLVEEFVADWRAELSQAELHDPKVKEDVQQTSEHLKNLFLRLKENTEAKQYLISASDKLKQWKNEHLNELAEAVVTTRSKTALETVESTKEELNKLRPEDLKREFLPKIEEATDAFTIQEKKTIFGELSKDPSILKKFRPQLDEELNLVTLTEREIKTSNSKAINEFAEARAGQRVNSEPSEAAAAHRAAIAGLTIADLMESLPEVDLARKFYIFKLVKAFEKLLEPLKKSTAEVIKNEIKRGFKIAYDTTEDLQYTPLEATKLALGLVDDAGLDSLFKQIFATELDPEQILANLKNKDVSVESGVKQKRELLDQLKSKGLLNDARHATLTSALGKDNEHYEYLLNSLNLKKELYQKMYNQIYQRLKVPLDSPQKEKLLDEVADKIVPQLLETLDLESKKIYLNPNYYREGKSPFHEVTELYSEEQLEKRVHEEVLQPHKDVSEFKKAHFVHVVSPPTIKPPQLTRPTSGFGANNPALESEFFDALKIPRDKYKSYELSIHEKESHPAFGRSPADEVENQKLDGRYMALYEDPLKVGDKRLKGTRFEYLSDTAINQLNKMAKTFGEATTQMSHSSQIESASRTAIQDLMKTLKPQEKLLTDILESLAI